jgi:hypothetical protein
VDGGWAKKVTGGIDWLKCHTVNGTRVCIGLEVQVSARSDLLVVDMIHLTTHIHSPALVFGGGSHQSSGSHCLSKEYTTI